MTSTRRGLIALLVALFAALGFAAVAPPVQAATINVALELNPTSIPADGASHSTAPAAASRPPATATLKDANGNGVIGATVVFGTNGDVTFGSVTDNNDGTYTTTITSSTTADVETISATAGGHTGTATLTEFGPA